jgi:epoxyqueuosine reductase
MSFHDSITAPDELAPDVATKLAVTLKAEAHRLGFELVGIAPAVTPAGLHHFLDWLEHGHAGEMEYLRRREAAYVHPQNVLDGVKSVVMLGINYNTQAPRRKDQRREETRSTAAERGTAGAPARAAPARIARYAQGSADYHDVVRGKLRELVCFLKSEAPGCRARGIVDTAPLLERDFARLAGLGWFGKNTMLINKHLGSWFFLAALLVDLELEYDAPHAASHCGTCTRCLDACPTGAFVESYVLDARRCISYLTIEHRGPIPEELRAGMGDWLFGCDICQEVCPWNSKAPVSREPAFAARPELTAADAAALLLLNELEFRQCYGKTALARPGRSGLVRNAAVVAGNSGNPTAAASLRAALDDDAGVVRDAAGWALGRLSRDNDSGRIG